MFVPAARGRLPIIHAAPGSRFDADQDPSTETARAARHAGAVEPLEFQVVAQHALVLGAA